MTRLDEETEVRKAVVYPDQLGVVYPYKNLCEGRLTR